MDRLTMNFLIGEVQRQHPKVDIYSWAFFFEPQYAEARSQHPLHGGTASKRTLLSLLIHEGMNDERRSEIFSNTFDLGNHRDIPPAKRNIPSLLDDLDLPYGINDSIKHIQKGIRDLTGRSIADHYKVDKSIALKALKTLYFLTRDRKETRLFSKLARPEDGKSGLEFRESYTHDKSSALSHLVSDVREYLGAELPTQRIIQIQQAFESILSCYEKAIQIIHDRITAIGTLTNESVRDIYDQLSSSIKSLQLPFASDDKVRLDESLYVHITSLPFRHFAKQYPTLYSIGINSPPLMSLADLIDVEQYDGVRIPILDIPLVLKSKAQFFQSIASTALKGHIDAKVLNHYAPLVTAVLDRVELFELGQSMIPEKRDTSLLRILTAICAIHLEHDLRTTHMPYWHGQQAIGDSLLASLKSSFSDEAVYEEHTQIWRIRLNWLFATLIGNADQFIHRNNLELLILRRFSDIARIQDVELIENATRGFVEHIASSCRFTVSIR